MKKIFLILVFLVGFLTGCSKNETTEPEKERTERYLASAYYEVRSSGKTIPLKELVKSDTLLVEIYDVPGLIGVYLYPAGVPKSIKEEVGVSYVSWTLEIPYSADYELYMDHTEGGTIKILFAEVKLIRWE